MIRLYDILRFRRMLHYGPVIGLILAGSMFVYGAFLIGMVGIPSLQNADESKNWVSTSGKIRHSRATLQVDHHPVTGRMVRNYRVQVLFEYQVDGKKYESQNISVNSMHAVYPSRGVAESIARKYPNGNTVTVYYNPDAPHEAVLQKGNSLMNYLPLMFGIGTVLISFLIAVGCGFWIFFRFKSGYNIDELLLGKKKKAKSAGTEPGKLDPQKPTTERGPDNDEA